MRRHDDRGRSAFDRELLDHQRICDVVEARAAVLLGNEDAEHPELAEVVHRRGGISMRPVRLDAGLVEFFARIAPRGIARAALSFCQFKIHLIPQLQS